jgi:hypothetical protein
MGALDFATRALRSTETLIFTICCFLCMDTTRCRLGNGHRDRLCTSSDSECELAHSRVASVYARPYIRLSYRAFPRLFKFITPRFSTRPGPVSFALQSPDPQTAHASPADATSVRRPRKARPPTSRPSRAAPLASRTSVWTCPS